MKLIFIPLDYDYVDVDDKCFVRIWGRTSEGKRCCVVDTCDAYFWLLAREGVNLEEYAEKVKAIKLEHAGRLARVVDVKIKEKKFMGKDVKALQVFVSNPKDIVVIKDIAKEFRETAEKKEHDINFVTRYIIEKDVKPLVWQVAEGREVYDIKYGDLDVDIVLEASSISKSREQPEFYPRVLAFDLEASEFELGKGQILMISLASLADSKIRKIFTWKKFKNAPEEVEFVADETELIEKFKEFVKSYRPDCLVGYFSDAFDLPYLRMRADEHKIRLDLGLDGSSVMFRRGIIPSSEIRGLVHIDLFKFVDNIIAYTLQSETLSLNDVARELVGEEKLKVDIDKIMKEFKEKKAPDEESELKKFCLYNLQDAILTSKLFQQLWPNIAELTRIVQEPLFDCSRASYSQLVESHIIHNLKEFNEIAQNRPTREEIEARRARKRYVGAYVFQPKPALYEKLAVFDFLALYPSIIISFNISPSTIAEKISEKEKSKFYQSPEVELERKKHVFYFSKEKGFIPVILSRLIETRKKVKEQLRKKASPILEARSYALKTLANATYGYYGFFGARYYSVECAASITAFGRYFLHKVIEEAQKAGFKVIYGDTDSIAIGLEKKTEQEALKWQESINRELPEAMELELEAFYKRGIFVTRRTGEVGAKKKYALLAKDGSIKIRGFETVRRDRCELAKETQDIVIRKVLEEGKADSAFKHVQKILHDIRKRKVPLEKLIIRTQLKKTLETYEAIGPHVVVAKKMQQRGIPVDPGKLIEYYIAEGKGKLIRERAKLPEEKGQYDIDYYIEHQIIPAVESIFAIFGIKKENLEEKQKKLGDF